MSDERTSVGRIERTSLWLLGLFLLAAALIRSPGNAVAGAAGIAIAVPAAAMAVTQRRRRHVAVGLDLIAGLGVVVVAGRSCSNVGWFGLCILALLCVLTTGPWWGHIFAVAALVFLCSRLAASGFNTGWLPWVGGVFVSALGGGLIVHEQRLLTQLRAAQAGLAERARTQERARIARELHDVIAHSLTVSLLHISAARMAVQHDPDDADRALGEAERLGRESLDEVRAIVGLTRADEDGDGGGSLAPTPGLDTFQALLERYRSAGALITAEVSTGSVAVPATIGTTAYRIAQEALTNAVRHAPGQPVQVRVSARNGSARNGSAGGVSAGGGSLELLVLSAGECTEVGAGNGGHGLNTMRERAEAVGGVLDAGPAGPGAGWRVRASLPLQPRSGWEPLEPRPGWEPLEPRPGWERPEPPPEWPCGRPR